jgi:predicted secreted protein
MVLAKGFSMVSGQPSSFGYTQVGDLSNSTFGGLYVSNFTGPGDLGNITQIRAFLSTGGTLAKAVIYLDDNGKPGALLNASAPVNVPGTSGEWVNFDVSYQGISQFKYWIGVLLVSAATYYSTTDLNGTAIYSAQTSEAATLFPLGTVSQNETMSVYAVFTPSAPQDQSRDWLQMVLFGVVIAGVVFAVIMMIVLVVKRQQKNINSHP